MLEPFHQHWPWAGRCHVGHCKHSVFSQQLKLIFPLWGAKPALLPQALSIRWPRCAEIPQPHHLSEHLICQYEQDPPAKFINPELSAQGASQAYKASPFQGSSKVLDCEREPQAQISGHSILLQFPLSSQQQRGSVIDFSL